MKKQTKHILILSAVLVICVGAWLGLRAWNAYREEQDAAQQEAEIIRLASLEDITSLSFENDGTELAFEKQDGTWVYAGDADFPLDQSYLENLETLLSDLTAVRGIEDADTMEAYGLASPPCQLTAGTSSGDSFQIYIGEASGDNYYARLEGSETVYTITSDLVSGISYELLDLAQLETFPTLSEENLESVTVDTGDSRIELIKETNQSEADVLQDTGEVDEDGNAIYETVTETVYTYTWYIPGDNDPKQEIPEGSSSLAGLLDVLSALAFDSCYSYQADDEAISATGLDSPSTVTVTYDEGTVILLIGDTDGDGNYYAMLEGSDMIHILSYDQAEVPLILDETSLLDAAEEE